MSDKDKLLHPDQISEESRRIVKDGRQEQINYRIILLIESLYAQITQANKQQSSENKQILTELADIKARDAMWNTPRGRFIVWLGGVLLTATLGGYLVWLGNMVIKHERELGSTPVRPAAVSVHPVPSNLSRTLGDDIPVVLR